jgi:N-ethylmaleimide reductase
MPVYEGKDLFSPMRLGPYELANRIVMAPLTRARAGEGDVPLSMTADYYAQRASAGLLIAEAATVSSQAKGYAWTPGIFNQDQVIGWRKVTEAVHAKGGRIFLQIWHVGRISHPDLQPGGALPVAPSAIRPNAEAFTEQGTKPAVTPRALSLEEIPGIIDQFRLGAENALAAGFDGVEIHGANGYLLDQFLKDGANHREDAYGGSIVNRARLMLDVTEAVIGVWGADRVGLRISPLSDANDLTDSNPQSVFQYLIDRLNAYGLAYLHVVEGIAGGPREVEGGFDLDILRRGFKGLYMVNNGYTLELANQVLRGDKADLIAFGRLFISNPDLVERLRLGAPLTPPDGATFFGGDAKGYIDYPSLQLV